MVNVWVELRDRIILDDDDKVYVQDDKDTGVEQE
jgi:hypothetical protein